MPYYKGTLPFLPLGSTVGVEYETVSTQDELSRVINIPVAFSFGNSTQTSVYVRCTHSYMHSMRHNIVIAITIFSGCHSWISHVWETRSLLSLSIVSFQQF